MGNHPLKGWARWIVFPAISAAGGALGFGAGKAPFEWGAAMGALLGLAPGIALAIAPRMIVGGPLALVLAFLGAMYVVPGPGALENLKGLLQPDVPNLVLGGSTLAAALLQGWRLREGVVWWWPNLVFQTIAGLAVPCLLWWFSLPMEMGTFFPFILLAAGHVAGMEAASFLSPRLE